jgi:hypothetical protein
MSDQIASQLFALAGVAFVCLIGGLFHARELRKMRREKAAGRDKPAHAGDHA